MLNSAEHEIYLANKIKMPTIVGILTFIRRIDTAFENLKQEKSLFFTTLPFMSSFIFNLSLVEHEKSFITLGPVCKL